MSIRKTNQVIKFLEGASEQLQIAQIKVMTARVQNDKQNTTIAAKVYAVETAISVLCVECDLALDSARETLKSEMAAPNTAKSDAAMIAATPELLKTTKK